MRIEGGFASRGRAAPLGLSAETRQAPPGPWGWIFPAGRGNMPPV